MCGEHFIISARGLGKTGSSPHVRGALGCSVSSADGFGIIPACAGSTSVACRFSTYRWDHPRMCGEHACTHPIEKMTAGSSPHVRGAQTVQSGTELALGIIPACAGSTTLSSFHTTCIGDHPRMCGEHQVRDTMYGTTQGSSPHVRGALAERSAKLGVHGIIPACAGSTVESVRSTAPRRDHPRMCGEHPDRPPVWKELQGSSPHVRGAHFENSIIPRKRKDNWLFFIQFRFENFLAFRYLLALLHPFLGVPTKDPSFASLGRLINCNPSQSTGDQSAPYTLKAICCSFLAE